ncbi:hypothetical protein DSM112329_00109 [Paraconexibacter sp. AEG42_29]|uniref:Glycosyltransferase 2-like domain-containing protein n=1 Tax=Paraconexibacter sp. AEG42_29 TaxID=2997339 RepID=A0AAU7ANT1_9ACTN
MTDATVMISTRDRCSEVSRAVRSALAQTVPVEVIVTDDGSSDGTAAHLEREFPSVRVIREETSKGSLVQRNAMALLATGSVLISLDDDAELPSPRTVEQVLAEFDHPRIAAVGIPFTDAPRPARLEHYAPPSDGHVLTSYFLGCCAALRRDCFNAVGGYDTTLRHSGEEPDMSLRWFARGWVVALGRSDLAIHHVSSARQHEFGVQYATRAEWRNVLRHVPARALPAQLGRLGGVAGGRSVVRRHPRAVAAGVADALRDRPAREPLEPEVYALWLQLERERRRGAPVTTLEELDARLPPLGSMPG